MGLDVREFRESVGQKRICESEAKRGKDLKNFYRVIELDANWRETKKSLDQTNAKLNENHKKIKQYVIGKSEIPETLLQENTKLESYRKYLASESENCKTKLEAALDLIGNVLEVPDAPDVPFFPKQKNASPLLNTSSLLHKQSTLFHFFLFFQQRSYDLIQTPSLALSAQLVNLFPSKRFLEIPAKRPKSLITNPLSAILLSYCKEKLEGFKKIAAYATCFSGNFVQTEKICLTVICNSDSALYWRQELWKDTQEFLCCYFLEVSCFVRPAERVSLRASWQLDFIGRSFGGSLIRVCTLSDFGRYVSRKGLIKFVGNDFAIVLSVKFSDLGLFVREEGR